MNICTLYYDNPDMLRLHVENWRRLSGVSVVLVDDGSPRTPAETVLRDMAPMGFPLRLFRADVDIPWNNPGARNLGMMHVQGWTLLTDIDRMITPKQWDKLRKAPKDVTQFYALNDHNTRGKRIGTHPGTFVMVPELYWFAGGFNEDFARHYGYDDVAFRKYLRTVARERLLDVAITVYGGSDVADARTTTYARHDDPQAAVNIQALMDLIDRPARAENPIRFPWHEVNLTNCVV